jgi:glutamate N-acetyltransferase / amino-acid N-acetyltransferase
MMKSKMFKKNISIGVKKIKAGITYPKGYLQSGINCGIKKKNPDLAIVLSEIPAVTCGVFTKNSFQAAPVVITKRHLKNKQHIGVIINSGNANCLTGRQGAADALSVAKGASSLIGCKAEELLLCSTGIIGKRLPVDRIKKAMVMLLSSLHRTDSGKAAKAIMTTDTFSKEAAYNITIGNKQVRIAGMAKGAGMISPDMATMIAVVSTDAMIKKTLLQKALKEAVDISFNSITIDGDMSTNDTVLVMANGLSGVVIKERGESYYKFVEALKVLCLDLAKMMVKDAEGATKFIEIDVNEAKDQGQAKRVALKIANSPLFKTMCYGEDPNFGRVASACGAVEDKIDANRVNIYLNGRIVVRKGVAVAGKLPVSLLGKKDINVRIDLDAGRAKAKIFTSDLTPEYVKINAAYS